MWWVIACSEPIAPSPVPHEAPTEACAGTVDEDGDGLVDCDDPDCDGQCPERCDNGRDDDGDGDVDCRDADCTGAACPEDCDDGADQDGDRLIDCDDPDCARPECPERCTGGRDDDGDNLVDCEDPDCLGQCSEVCSDGLDGDGDGAVDCEDPDCEPVCSEQCANDTDDDADGDVDCDDLECAATCDVDGDGETSALFGGDDCDDRNAAVHSDAPETCGGIDDDCDGLIDDADPDTLVASMRTWYPDWDGDGFGRGLASLIACTGADRTVDNDLDCADHDATTFPGAGERCTTEGWDEDCDHLLDEADPDFDLSTLRTWYADGDGDGWGDPNAQTLACDALADTVDNALDCDDSDANAGFPLFWYADTDGDGFGDAVLAEGCDAPGVPTAFLNGDCDDDDPAIAPTATESCNGVDDDCDDAVDLADEDAECVWGDTNDFADLFDVVDPSGSLLFGSAVAVAADAMAVSDGTGLVWLWASRSPESDPIVLAGGPSFGTSVALLAGELWVGEPDIPRVARFALPSAEPLTDLTLPDETADWGHALAATGGFVALGAPSAFDGAGAVAVAIQGAPGAWTTEHLPAPEVPVASLGRSVAVDGAGIVAAGASDAVALWLDDANPPTLTLGEAGADFGRAVARALAGTAVGAPGAGLVRWLPDVGLAVDLVPPHAPAEFGATLAGTGNRLAVGAPSAAGEVLLYAPLNDGWLLVAQVAPRGATASAATEVLAASDPSPGVVCEPFGLGDGGGDHMGAVWAGVPAFDLLPGDVIAFDLMAPNDVDIIVDIALAGTVEDGTDEPAGPLVTVATAARATAPRGDDIRGNFELAFIVEEPFSFSGGGLVLQLTPRLGYANDETCTPNLEGASATDPSGHFVARTLYEYDGDWPWNVTSAVSIPEVQFLTTRRPGFGAALALADDALLVGAPGSPTPEPASPGDWVPPPPPGHATLLVPTPLSPW